VPMSFPTPVAGASRVVMFDYDGVIVDSLQVFLEAMARAFADIGRPELATPATLLGFLDTNWFAGLAGAGLTAEQTEQIEDVFSEALSHYESLRPFPGMSEALARLAERHELSIITSCRAPVARGFLAAHGITAFTHVIGCETEKSKVRRIERTMAEYGPGREYWYVGDTTGDIREGRAAGAVTVGVAWGWHGAARLAAAAPDFIVATPQELADLIDR
jgi:phosphoglycolate phosphatase